MYYCSLISKEFDEENKKLLNSSDVLFFSRTIKHNKIFFLNDEKYPIELDFFYSLKKIIKDDCYYFLDLCNFDNYQKYLELKNKEEDFFFINNENINVTNIFCNLKDRANFILKFGEFHSCKFPLIIKGSLFKKIIEYISIAINYDVFYFQIEIIFAVMRKIIND